MARVAKLMVLLGIGAVLVGALTGSLPILIVGVILVVIGIIPA